LKQDGTVAYPGSRIIYCSEYEAGAINEVLRSQQWSSQNPSNISRDREAWEIAVKYGFAQASELPI
jgi:hypothetical protein